MGYYYHSQQAADHKRLREAEEAYKRAKTAEQQAAAKKLAGSRLQGRLGMILAPPKDYSYNVGSQSNVRADGTVMSASQVQAKIDKGHGDAGTQYELRPSVVKTIKALPVAEQQAAAQKAAQNMGNIRKVSTWGVGLGLPTIIGESSYGKTTLGKAPGIYTPTGDKRLGGLQPTKSEAIRISRMFPDRKQSEVAEYLISGKVRTPDRVLVTGVRQPRQVVTAPSNIAQMSSSTSATGTSKKVKSRLVSAVPQEAAMASYLRKRGAAGPRSSGGTIGWQVTNPVKDLWGESYSKRTAPTKAPKVKRNEWNPLKQFKTKKLGFGGL